MLMEQVILFSAKNHMHEREDDVRLGNEAGRTDGKEP
jgi:hypothetical protein